MQSIGDLIEALADAHEAAGSWAVSIHPTEEELIEIRRLERKGFVEVRGSDPLRVRFTDEGYQHFKTRIARLRRRGKPQKRSTSKSVPRYRRA